ncbi:MAG: ABC transporter substrate-binding protein, partial [Actinoplanes sp.]
PGGLRWVWGKPVRAAARRRAGGGTGWMAYYLETIDKRIYSDISTMHSCSLMAAALISGSAIVIVHSLSAAGGSCRSVHRGEIYRRLPMRRRTVLGLGGGVLLAGGAACGDVEGGRPDRSATATIVLGFSQVGSESGWRLANTKSIKDSAELSNVELHFDDGQGKQENQIKAIRSFIAEKVDVIAFSPVIESGWDQVLTEAKRAGIPVVLTDRLIDSPDTTLYRSSVGADFIAEGNQAGLFLLKEYEGDGRAINVVELAGTPNSAPTKQRTQGFLEVIGQQPKFRMLGSVSGQWTRVGGAKAMRTLLSRHERIDVVFAQNDDMGLGALGVLERAGLEPGKDVKLITVDATRAGLTALAAGKLNFVVECSPVIGKMLMKVVVDIYLGGTVRKRVLSEKVGFDQATAKIVLPDRVY